jgi:replicative DNA helicase
MNARDPSLHREAPANVEAEQALLGAIMVNNDAYDRVASFLEPEHFYERFHQEIFARVAEMRRAGQAVTPITIKGYLRQPENLKLDGEPATVMQYLIRLASDAVSVINARDFGRAILDLSISRKAIVALEDAVDQVYGAEPGADVLRELAPLEERLAVLRSEGLRSESKASAGRRYLESLNASVRREIAGVPIGISAVARVISEPCFEPGNLYGLLSSSGEGKTSLTLQLIYHAVERGHPVLFLSFDQSPEQCVRQMAAQVYGIEARRQRGGDLSEKEMDAAVMFGTWIDQQPFDVIKCTDQRAAQLVGMARTFLKRKANGRAPLVVIDHIGAIEPEDKRADEGTKAKGINQILKAGAETTGAAWLVLNQRNSYGMKRDNPRPISADLFGGDPAKQAYDAIAYVYRYLKYLEERKAIASSEADWKKINKVFPSAVRDEGIDLAEIGAIKVRFGSPHIRENLIFEARYTRYRPEHPESELIEQDRGFGF